MQIRLKRIGALGSKMRVRLDWTVDSQTRTLGTDMTWLTDEEYRKGTKPIYEILFNEKERFRDIKIDLETGKGAQPTTEEYKRWQKQSNLYSALINHNQIKSKNSKPTASVLLCEMVDVNEEMNDLVLDIKNNLIISNHINNLDENGLYNVCAYINKSVKDLTIQQIFIELLKPPVKVIEGKRETIVRGWAFDNIKKILSMDKDEDAILTIIVNKAIQLGIIESKSGSYFYGGQAVSATLDNLYLWFKNHPDMFNNGLKLAVQEQDKLPVSGSVEKDLNKSIANTNQANETKQKSEGDYSAEEVEILRKRLASLGVLGTAKMLLPTMIERLPLAEKEYKEKHPE